VFNRSFGSNRPYNFTKKMAVFWPITLKHLSGWGNSGWVAGAGVKYMTLPMVFTNAQLLGLAQTTVDDCTTAHSLNVRPNCLNALLYANQSAKYFKVAIFVVVSMLAVTLSFISRVLP
jgi:hypothetical protein